LLDTFGVGEPQAAGFHDLWMAHARDVYRFAFYLSGSQALADDLTSEAFLRVWDAWDRVAFPTVRSYLFATVRNLYLHQLRRSRREESIEAAIPDMRSLAEHAEQKDELARVLAAMRQLPELDRSALLLRVEEGLPYEDIASILGLPVATAKVKVHRARLRLAQMCQRSSTL
jgi:RNA polymerase sigma-70 factor (ECF subfamily)